MSKLDHYINYICNWARRADYSHQRDGDDDLCECDLCHELFGIGSLEIQQGGQILCRRCRE